MNKIYQTLLVVSFLLMITLPLGGMLIKQSEEVSEKEKRRLAALPELRFSSSMLDEFPTEYTRYFNDHYGFRTDMIDMNKGIKRAVFNKSAVRMVVRGEQDWLFLDDHQSLYDHVGLVPMNEDILSGWQQNLINKQRWLAQKGIEYLFVPVPNKMTIYPEKMPARVRHLAGSTMLEKLISYMDEQKKFDAFVKLKPLFLEQKANNDRLYYYTDSHWSSLGAFWGYQKVMQRLQQQVPQLEPALEFDDLQHQKVKHSTDLNVIFGEGDGKPEEISLFQVKNKCANLEAKEILSFKKTKAFTASKKKKIPWTNGCSNKKLTAMVGRDSFGRYIEPFLSESFKRVVFMRPYDLLGMESFLDMESFIDKEKPDVYIEIRVERNVKYHLKPDPRMQLAVEKITS